MRNRKKQNKNQSKKSASVNTHDNYSHTNFIHIAVKNALIICLKIFQQL